MDKKIFFSYGHDEYKDFVLKVQKYLEDEEGFQVFVDSDKLRSGDDWEHKLEQAIVENHKMVFFITKHAARRPDGYCLNEISMALAHDIKVFPVMLEKHILPLSLIRKQFLDLQTCINEDREHTDGIFVEQMKYLVEALRSNSDLEHGDIQQKLIKRLKPIDFQLDYAMHGRLIGREWIMDEIDHWLKEKPESKVLWITAEAGYGKSAISAYLSRYPKVMSVHFCNYNSPRTQDPRNVIKTLAYSLQAQQIEGYREEIEHVELENKTAVELFQDLIANPLAKVKREGSLYLFVIDALDETLNDENMELITLLGSDEFRWGLPDFVKIIITSRPEAKIRQAISKFYPLVLNTESQNNSDDCEVYIEARLNELNKDKIDENNVLIDVIMENSGANMLYITKFFDDDTLDLSQPDKFPKDLQEIYWRFFRRVTKDIDEYDEKLSPILEVMLAYAESIPRLLLQDMLGLSQKILQRRLNMFGSMFRESDGKLDFYHKSLRDWLVSKENEDYFVDINEGKKKIHIFMDQLTKETYQEEYFEFEHFNQMLVDRIYEKEENLNRYFELIASIPNDEKNIKLLYRLGVYNALHHNIDITIELNKRNLDVIEKKYALAPKIWDEIYFNTLKALSEAHLMSGKDDDAKIFYYKAQEFLVALYQKDKEKWKSDLARINNTNIEFLAKEEKYSLVYAKGIENMNFIEKYYYENIPLWGKAYSISIAMTLMSALQLKKKGITKKLISKYDKYIEPNKHIIKVTISVALESMMEQLKHTNSEKNNKKKTGRNDLCPCGSGEKYKKCCGNNK